MNPHLLSRPHSGATCCVPHLIFAPHSHLLSFPFTLATPGHLSSSPQGLISHSAPLSGYPRLRSSEGASGRSSPPFPARAQARDPIDVGPQQEVLRPHCDMGTPLCQSHGTGTVQPQLSPCTQGSCQRSRHTDL